MSDGVRDDQFLGEELSAAENDMATARFEVVPCGLDATVSYGTGAAKGPDAIMARRRYSPPVTSWSVW